LSRLALAILSGCLIASSVCAPLSAFAQSSKSPLSAEELAAASHLESVDIVDDATLTRSAKIYAGGVSTNADTMQMNGMNNNMQMNGMNNGMAMNGMYSNANMEAEAAQRAIGVAGTTLLLGTFLGNGGIGGMMRSVGWGNTGFHSHGLCGY
jgi:hypothetical protein